MKLKLIFILILPFFCYSQTESTPLKIAVYDSPPFGMKSPSGEIQGLMVDIWEDIAKDLNLKYTYEITDMETLLSGLEAKKFDIGLGAISITPERERRVDFTQPVNPSGTGIAVNKSTMGNSLINKWSPILINLLELIGVLLFMLFISAGIVLFIEKRYSKGDHSDSDIKTISDGLWWSAVTMTTVGYGDKVPRSILGKILGIIWIFTSIIFFSLFTANASSELSSSSIESDINSAEDLRNVKVTAVNKSSGAEYLKNEMINVQLEDNINEAIENVISGKSDAIVSNLPVLKYYNRIFFNNSLLISENYLIRNNMGIALQDESPLREAIDLLLLKKISEPKWQQTVYKYIGN